MNIETETIDRLFLELSQFTNATTGKEIVLGKKLKAAHEANKEIGDALEKIAKHFGFDGLTATEVASRLVDHP